MNLAIFPILAVLASSISLGSAMSEGSVEIRVHSGDFVMSSEGGVRVDMKAAGLTRLEDGSVRITAPATLRLTPVRDFSVTFSGTPSFELELHPAKAGVKSVRVAGATIRLEGDGTQTLISSAASISIIQ